MRVKFENQYLYQIIAPSAGAVEKNELTELPTLLPGDAVYPKGLGVVLVGGGMTTTAAGYTEFIATLASNRQDTPVHPFSAMDVFWAGGWAYGAGAAGESTPPLMEVEDSKPLPMGLPVTPAVSGVYMITKYSNVSIAGTLGIGVFLSYDIVTLTTREMVQLIG